MKLLPLGACAILLLLVQPVLGQTMTGPAAVARAPVNGAPNVTPADSNKQNGQGQRLRTLPSNVRQNAENSSINAGTNEARARADAQMNAATTSMAVGIASGASQIGAGASGQASGPAPDIETRIQQTLGQSAQDSNSDLRETASAVQQENQRRRALREAAECTHNAANSSPCPCPTGTQRSNGQCVAAAN